MLPAGSCYSVGLGGHICGGGYGLLSRLNGLTVDWLTGVEVVVKDSAAGSAYPVYVSAKAIPTRVSSIYTGRIAEGAGGNFGIICKYYFKDLLKSTTKTAFLTSLAFPWADLTEQILGDELSAWYAAFAQRTDNWRQFGLFALNHQANQEIHLTIQTAVMGDEDAEEIRKQYINPLLSDLKA